MKRNFFVQLLFVSAIMLMMACIVPAYAAKPAKESGAQMEPETNAAYADAYKRLEQHSRLKGIGKPVGYACDGSMSEGFSYKPNSGTLKQEDKEAYAKAIWNLCLDVADAAPYKKQYRDGKNEKIEYKSILEAMTKSGDFVWHYAVDGKEYRAMVYFKNDNLILMINNPN